MMAAPPGSELFSKAMARAPASRASIPAATPAPPAPTIAMSVSYCLTPAICRPPIGGGPTLNAPIEKLNDVRQGSFWSDGADARAMSCSTDVARLVYEPARTLRAFRHGDASLVRQ